MYDLANFDLADMVQCGAALRGMSGACSAMEDVAERIVGYLHESLTDGEGKPACALVRFYKTHPYGALPDELRTFADGVLGDGSAWDEMKCLTLLATTGDEPAWRSRASSSGHKAIPLPTEDFVGRIPMIHRLVGQLGLDVKNMLAPDPSFLLDVEQKTFNVFHVAEATNSPFIPAQDFVATHGIRSVLGFGGMLMSGDLFTIILFSKVAIPRETAELFATLALGVKMALHPFLDGRVFAAPAAAAE
jgi:hypothetical protein